MTKKEQVVDKSLAPSPYYSDQQAEWWFPIWWTLNRTRWSVSQYLRMPILPPALGESLPNMTIGQFLLYGLIMLQLPIAYLSGLSSLNGGEDVVESSGNLAKISLWVAFFLGQKQIAAIAIYFLGMSFDRMIPFHKLASKVAIALGALHGALAYVNRFDLEGGSGDAPAPVVQPAATGPETFASVATWFFTGEDNWSGTLLVLSMVILTLSSMFYIIRRKAYYVWLLSHILFSVAVLVLGLIHFGVSVPILIAWVFDLLYRYGYNSAWRYPHQGTAKRLGETSIVRLSFPKTKEFFYQPGQFVKIGLPFADKLVFHPLSVASTPEVDEDEVVVYVRAAGQWTTALLEHSKVSPAKESKSAASKKDVDLFVEGPYGSSGIDLYAERKHVLLCIGGGVGGSTCLSVAKWLLAKDKVAKLRFVWTVREWELVEDALPGNLLENSDKAAIGSSRSQSAQTAFLEIESSQSSDDEENQGGKGVVRQSRRGRLVETDLYLTRAPESPPLRKTPTTTVFHGTRPKWDQIFEQTRKDAFELGYSRVSVVCCGPMIKEIERACRKYSCANADVQVTFDLHEESFEL